jgi:hypothetical protein
MFMPALACSAYRSFEYRVLVVLRLDSTIVITCLDREYRGERIRKSQMADIARNSLFFFLFPGIPRAKLNLSSFLGHLIQRLRTKP